jgi:hypothetical protein
VSLQAELIPSHSCIPFLMAKWQTDNFL